MIMLRSILAVIAGLVTLIVTGLGGDVALRGLAPQWFAESGRVENVPALLLMVCYTLIFSVLSGYVAALVAKRQEIKHAFILGLIQLALNIVATIKFSSTAPAWFHLAIIVLLVPATVFGGQLRLMQKAKADPRSFSFLVCL